MNSIVKLIICFLICLLLSIDNVYPCEYTKEEICSAIWIIEGGESASQHYGINPKYITCKTKSKCRQICYNTIENNRKRYADYGYKQYKTYLEFLASRYCPKGENLCENWLPNLKYYLEKGK